MGAATHGVRTARGGTLHLALSTEH